jgi:hypothetical protein
VLSCRVSCCLIIMPCLVVSCLVLPYLILSCLAVVLSCLVSSCLILSCGCLVLPCLVWFRTLDGRYIDLKIDEIITPGLHRIVKGEVPVFVSVCIRLCLFFFPSLCLCLSSVFGCLSLSLSLFRRSPAFLYKSCNSLDLNAYLCLCLFVSFRLYVSLCLFIF